MPHSYIFTITTGRSGTGYLAELLRQNVRDVEAHHEFSNYDSIGVDAPDATQLMQFNTWGNNGRVREFWLRKLAKITRSPSEKYVETSHLLAKSGLVENIDLLGSAATVYLVIVRRDAAGTLKSFLERNDFVSNGNAMMYYLQWNYRKNLVKPARVDPVIHWAAWYIAEMRVRSAYYKAMMASRNNVRFVETTLKEISTEEGARKFMQALDIPASTIGAVVPPPTNVSPRMRSFTNDELKAIAALGRKVDELDTEKIGVSAFQEGRRF